MAKFAKIIHKSNENFLINKFIGLFKRKIRIKGKRRFSLVLTGGKSPLKLYKNLAMEKDIPWKKIDFFLTDERYVGENSKHSNINMCKKKFLNKMPISNKQIYMMSVNKKKINKISEDYENKIKKYFLGKKVAFDLVILGVGKDGHVASLFEENVLKKNKKIVDVVSRRDFSRITLTLKCLNNSKNIFLWVPGKGKLSIIKKIILDKGFNFPVSFINIKNKFLFYSN